MKYHVFYHQRCSPFLRTFESRSKREKWIVKFDHNEDDWIDMVITGDVEVLEVGGIQLECSHNYCEKPSTKEAHDAAHKWKKGTIK